MMLPPHPSIRLFGELSPRGVDLTLVSAPLPPLSGAWRAAEGAAPQIPVGVRESEEPRLCCHYILGDFLTRFIQLS